MGLAHTHILATVVKVTAVAGVALHTQVTGDPRCSLTVDLQGRHVFRMGSHYNST